MAFIKSNIFFTPTSETFLPIPGLFPAFIALSANKNLFKQFMQTYLAAQTTALTVAPSLALNSNAGP